MARVIRSCWVYKPLHRYRVFPRPDRKLPYDYEKEAAGPAHFPDTLSEEERPKLWAVWIYKNQRNYPYRMEDQFRILFGEDFEPGRMHIFKNIPSVNKELWKIKHLIDIRPVTFPYGEPTEDDLLHTRVYPDGRCVVDQSLNADPATDHPRLTSEPMDLSEDAHYLKTRLTQRMINSNTGTRYARRENMNEDEQWTDPNISRL